MGELEGLCEDLADANIHGIDLILAGITSLTDTQFTASETKTVLSILAGTEGVDLLTAIGLTVQHLAEQVKDLPDTARSEVGQHAKEAMYAATYDTAIRTPVISTIGALDTEGR